MSEHGESFDSKFERFAAKTLQNHAQVLGVLNAHGDQLKDVKQKLDEHLYDHLAGLQKSLEQAQNKSSKNIELWIGTIIGAAGLLVALLAVLKN